jgi:signal transduction histidine kinase
MKKTDFAKQQKLLFWIIGSGLFVLLLVNMFGWLYLQRIKTYFISDLQFRLENITNLSAKLIDPNDISYIFPGDNINPQSVFYQNRLFEIKDNNNLQDIYIMSPTREILVDPTPDFQSIDFAERSPDVDLVKKALNGTTATGDLQTLGDHKFLTAVAPLIDSDNLITGLLVVEVRADFFDMLDQFDRGVMVFSILNAIIILGVAVFLFRSVKKVFLLQNFIKNQEHLVRLGEMAASVAHEIRNPLGIMKGANSLIQKKYGKQYDEVFTYIPAELERLNRLIEDFLAFSRNRDVSIQPVNLRELLTKLEVGFSEHKKFEFCSEFPENLPLINTDQDALEQILLNIIKNSVQSNTRDGKIEIRCEKVSKNRIEIHISDKGPGIPAELINRVFDPFFTTRDEGSGLGLAISKRLIEQLRGEILLQSTPGVGTTVTISIPIK